MTYPSTALAVIEKIFYAHGFVGRDVDACNQYSWHHTSNIQICKLLIVRGLDFFMFEIFSNFSRNEDWALVDVSQLTKILQQFAHRVS